MSKFPLSKRWNREIHLMVRQHLKITGVRAKHSRVAIPNAQTMPNIGSINIGEAKRMDVAILFFDLEDFTKISSQITMEQTLELLNYIIPSVMHVIRYWRGVFEKNTGDGVMAILGAETKDLGTIAQDAIECAMAIRYVMENEVQPTLVAAGLPHVNFRIGIDMGNVLVGKIGVHSHNFLSAIGTIANIANKLQSHARPNGICIGEALATNLHSHLHQYCEVGDDPDWNWQRVETGQPYNHYHYNHDWPDPLTWTRTGFLQQARML
jgi:adenylate cyclase